VDWSQKCCTTQSDGKMFGGPGSCDSSSSHLVKRSFSSREIGSAEESTRVKSARLTGLPQTEVAPQRSTEPSASDVPAPVPEHLELEEGDEEKMDTFQYNIEGVGKYASSSLKDILLQVLSLEERLVPVEIGNVPDSENLKFERLIQQVLQEIPEYVPGKFILKTPQSHHKGIISGRIFSLLDGWNGGISSLDSIMTTNQNQRRAPDVEWRQMPLTDAQENNSTLPRPMPDLWIEICYNRTGDRDAAFLQFGRIIHIYEDLKFRRSRSGRIHSKESRNIIIH
jgi:hypothetical protein